ncbi:MAG TPA: hypothetical protein VGE52_04435, partial [Pirellulales bacterium]
AVGQSARFTVDAYPDRVFTGKVQAVWPNASLVSEVVSYPVIISVDEAGGLMPYLTANVQIVVERRDDALVVSEQALTWVPAVDLIEPTQREKYQAAVAAQTQSGPQGERKGVLWTPTADERVRFVEVVVGPSDGVDTVVSPIDAAEGLKVGEEFITGLRRRDSARGNGGLPFVGKKREAE